MAVSSSSLTGGAPPVAGGATHEADSTIMGTSTSPEEPGATSHGQNPVSTPGAAAASTHGRSHLGAILGGVFGVIAAVVLVICVLLCLARRRRRRREKEAMLASGPLDWWRQTDILPRLMKREPSESSTIKADDLDYDDDMDTLHATSVEKKSVTYGEYPDL
ncbi:uncharacterized protein TRAVEDRAFT_57241 [Trametes versicolor FP-101664 SS1]|uniref:uncharacterized protein n=1 Tax=Trametes versicolor (strain FP-101664) TaxID=717944 RepID=UPI0004622CAD|nr:uncharacterized protein TRAVEDRAFT_57241 [Trametes versicolor FP-101664 SS1]EIW62158.1 hypothetical protein TRAVEDRAFT_57241 [Trametes versicolor FP-101664 SS1]